MKKSDLSTAERGKKLFIIQAALEYLISIIINGSFLATLTKTLGISDSLTGIISSFISLGCLFQLLSLFIHRPRSKPLVIGLTLLNQLLYISMYIIPLLSGDRSVKTACFVTSVFIAWVMFYFAHPKKMAWFMSLVDDRERGSFTANKEIISLIAGMIFQFSMGALVDFFAEKGELRTAFVLSAIVLVFMSILHTLCMVFTPEKPIEQRKKVNFTSTLKAISKNKRVLKACIVCIIYYAANYASIPYYATYNINELGFSLKVITLIAISGSISRIFVSRFWGKYADKNSFASMVEKCFMFYAAGTLCYVFASPASHFTRVVPLLLYILLHGISMGGINSALTNLVFDYAEPEIRADSLAVCQALSGVVGFLSTLAVSPIVSIIQKNGNSLFGMTIYAQQILSVITLLLIIALIIYIRTALINKKS